MWQGLQGISANIYGVYLGTVWRESEDMAQWSSLFQVRALAITFSFFIAAPDIYVQGATVKIRGILTQVMGREQ